MAIPSGLQVAAHGLAGDLLVELNHSAVVVLLLAVRPQGLHDSMIPLVSSTASGAWPCPGRSAGPDVQLDAEAGL
ncbi:MAG: hypothetical protein L7F78_08300 [Syntrophales bacterium LBB04]|nr:hypothetical protein [Syntrophales bacterium LBB04]